MAKKYLRQLELMAWWRLPPREAEEVAEDYREMMEEQSGSPELLESRWGSPLQAVRLVEKPNQYRRWLLAFGMMAACVLLPACWLLGERQHPDASACLAALGAAASLAWFSRQGRKKAGRPPRALWAALLCQLLLALLAGGTLVLAAYQWLDLAQAGLLKPGLLGGTVGLVFTLAGLGCAALALLGLLLARLKDRRWRAVYILGLTILALCLLVLSVLRSMSLDSSIPGWQWPYLLRAALTALIGLLAAGVGLC